MMGDVAAIVRLRWTLTIATMRKSVLQAIGGVIGVLMGLGVIAFVAALGMALGSGHTRLDQFHATTVLVGSFIAVAVVLVQVLYLGQGSTLSPGRFALYGIDDRTLSLGLLAAGLAGIPSIIGTMALLAWSTAFRSFGALAVIVQIIAAPLAVLTIMSLSKLAIAAATSLVRSKRGRNAFYVIAVLLFVFFAQIPNIMAANAPGASVDVASAAVGVHLGADLRLNAYAGMADALAWTPFGAAFQLPFDALAGAWGLLAARLAVLAATIVLCFAGCTACLRHDRMTAGASAAPAVSAAGLGAFSRMADSPSGAISARLLTYLRHDARQSMLFAMPIIFVVIMALQSHGESIVIWIGLIMSGWFMFIGEGNGLAYDGRGYAMEVISGVRGLADRAGRARLLASLATIYLLALAALIIAFCGDWRSAERLMLDMGFFCLALAMAYASLGVAETASVVLMYPVPSIDKPFSSPQGRALAQGFFPLVQMLGAPLTLLPTGLAALAMGLWGVLSAGTVPVLGFIALVNGLAVLNLGTWLGGKLLDARSLSVLRTLDGFASLQQ